MTDEVIDGTADAGADEQPVDLRSTIVAAVEKQRANAEPAEAQTEAVETNKAATAENKPTGERERDEQGRFAKSGEAKATGEEAKAETPDKPEVPEKDDAAQALKPPGGWSPTAKAAFAELPQVVKDAVAKREQEVNNGFAKLAEYKPIDRFVEMAKQSGTTLDKALESYVGIENMLRADFLGGIAHLCQRYGAHPIALANAILARSGGSSSQQGDAGASERANQQASQVDLSPLQQQIAALDARLTQQDQQSVQSEITRFASDPNNVFFDNVKAEMGRLIEMGAATDLQQAYDMACWNNQEIRGLLIKQQMPAPSGAKAVDAVQQAKAAAKAIGGAPSAGFKPDKTPQNLSLRETIRAAVDAQRGA